MKKKKSSHQVADRSKRWNLRNGQKYETWSMGQHHAIHESNTLLHDIVTTSRPPECPIFSQAETRMKPVDHTSQSAAASWGFSCSSPT